MIKKTLLAAAVASAPLFVASPAAAAGFINGSFEANCGAPVAVFTTLGSGSTCVTGWTVGPHSVDLVGGYWQAKDGTHSIDLGGNAPGSISQIFDTVVGGLYTVNYWLSGNPDGGDFPKFGTIAAIDGSLVQSATFLGLQGSNHANMNYLPYQFTFTATGTQTELMFASDPTEGAYGPVLDAVSITAPVPEPATWAMMLFGFGAIGFSLRKRKAVNSQARIRVAYA